MRFCLVSSPSVPTSGTRFNFTRFKRRGLNQPLYSTIAVHKPHWFCAFAARSLLKRGPPQDNKRPESSPGYIFWYTMRHVWNIAR